MLIVMTVMNNKTSFRIAAQIFLCGHATYSIYCVRAAFPSLHPPDIVAPERPIVEKMVETIHAGL
jgi:hypothetical protein